MIESLDAWSIHWPYIFASWAVGLLVLGGLLVASRLQLSKLKAQFKAQQDDQQSA